MNGHSNALSFSRKRRRRRRWRAALAAIVTLVLAWIAYVQWLIHFPPNQATEARGDVAIVLGAALWNDRPSPGLRERLDLACKLFQNGAVDRLIVSGGLDGNGSKLTEAEGMKRYLVERGVPAESIVLEPEAKSTYENLLFSKRIMDRQGWAQAVIVTHVYHGARAIDVARFVGLSDAKAALTESQVMWMPRHILRETLAYTKWTWDKLLMRATGSVPAG